MEGTVFGFLFDQFDLGPLKTSLSLITAFVIDVQPHLFIQYTSCFSTRKILELFENLFGFFQLEILKEYLPLLIQRTFIQ